MLTLGSAMAAALAVTAPAFAQGGSAGSKGVIDVQTLLTPATADQRTWGGGYNTGGYQNGYNRGLREGERDVRDGKDYGYKRDDAYEDADRGYRGGNRGAYRADFRRGYEDGYEVGWRRAGGYGRRGNVYPPPYSGGYPDGGYRDRDYRDRDYRGPGSRGNRIAFDNGYSDGYEAGRRDADRRRRFDPTGEDRYRSGMHGYESRLGSRDWYRDEYRNGFRSGYAAGYRNEYREDRRW